MNPLNQTTEKRAIIYCRVSTKEQVEEGNSLATQEKFCKEYAAKNGYNVVQTFIEQGESAKTQDRTELQKLLTFCANSKNKINIVISYKLDRISRNTDDYSQIRILLKRYGVEIKSTTEYFENTPAGRFMENIIANVAQFDNDVRTERSVGGMREAMRDGRYVWRAPLGYENVKINGRSTIALNSIAPLVRDAFEMVAQNNQSIDEVRRIIYKRGLMAQSGKCPSKSFFFKILRNETYAGWIIKFGERHKGLFEPIISQEIFNQVDRVLKGRSHRTLQYCMENPDFPLRRFVKHLAGATLTGGWSKGRSKKYPYYRFIKNNLGFTKDDFEGCFGLYMNQFKLADKHHEKLLQYAKENFSNKNIDNEKAVLDLEKYIQSLQENQQALIQKNLKGVISDTILRQQLEFIDKKLLEANARLLRIPKQKGDLEATLNFVSEFLKDPGKTWLKLPFEKQVALQWFNFPQGVLFDGVKFRTAQISNVFKGNSFFLNHQFSKVHLGIKSLNHQKSRDILPQVATFKKSSLKNKDLDNKLFDDFSWDKYQDELNKIADILKENN